MHKEEEHSKLQQKIKELEAQNKKLSDEKKILDKLLESLPGEFFVFNEKRQMIRWNKRHEENSGYVGAESLGKPPAFFIDESDIKAIEKAVEEVFKKGEATVEGAVLAKDGRKIPHYYSAVKITIGGENMLLGFGLDISELKKAQKQVLSSQVLYQMLAENLSEGVLIANREKNVYVNSALADIIKISIDDLMKMKPKDLFHEKQVYESILNKITVGKEFVDSQVLFHRGDGEDVWLDLHCRPIEWEGKKALIATVRDSTKQRKEEIVAQRKAKQLKDENMLLRSKYSHSFGLGHMVGKSPKMQDVYGEILTAATLDTNVVIYGESGTGKELAAKSIHELSSRKNRPFIAVNCGAIPENLFESEFFGHKKGAFSGAVMNKVGFFESAEKGTLFLDEIGEIPLTLQAKLLRVIEGSGFSPVGSTEQKKPDVRVIAATNRDLKQMVREGRLRQDFYYRIHVIPIFLPPLRERKEDLPLLIYHFIEDSENKNERKFIPDTDMEMFQLYDWPGNVRELQNTIARYVAFDSVQLEGIRDQAAANSKVPEATIEIDTSSDSIHLKQMVDEYEKQLIKKFLDSTGGVKAHAAKKLGIQRRSLIRKIQRLGI